MKDGMFILDVTEELGIEYSTAEGSAFILTLWNECDFSEDPADLLPYIKAERASVERVYLNPKTTKTLTLPGQHRLEFAFDEKMAVVHLMDIEDDESEKLWSFDKPDAEWWNYLTAKAKRLVREHLQQPELPVFVLDNAHIGWCN